MVRRTLHRLGGRLVAPAMLAIILAVLPVTASDLSQAPVLHATIWSLGAARASAQGGMDVGILTPSFGELPRSISPGETFVVGVSTAPGARCSGQVAFRDHPPIDLEEVAAPGGTCSWAVTVPPTVRLGTATIEIPITRNGQWWTLNGVVYVRPVGESREPQST